MSNDRIIKSGAEMAARCHQNSPPMGLEYHVRYELESFPYYELRFHCGALHTRITYKLYDDGPNEKFGVGWTGPTSVFLADPLRIAREAEETPLRVRTEAIMQKVHSE